MSITDGDRRGEGRPWSVEADGSIRLLASLDQTTGRHYFPTLPESSPQARNFVTVALAPEAVLYCHTTIYPSPKSGKPPFTLVYADFPERVRVFGKLKCDGSDRPRIGARLRVELENQPDGSVDYVFKAEH